MLAEILSIGLNNCLQCGSFAVRKSMLCSSCEVSLFKNSFQSAEFSGEVHKIPCFGLFQWYRDRNRILNRLSLALKGGRQRKAWDHYAELFLLEWLKAEAIPSSVVLVPCPSHKGGPDHAYWFAEALSRKTGIPLCNYLECVDVNEQKKLSRQERQRLISLKFRLKQDINEKFSRVYFVDDIITTGATVFAAHSLLKKLGPVKGIALLIRR